MMVPMAVIRVGRDFYGWPISGHLADILAVALIQSVDRRLHAWERLAYGHAETSHALLAATAMFAAYLIGAITFRRYYRYMHG